MLAYVGLPQNLKDLKDPTDRIRLSFPVDPTAWGRLAVLRISGRVESIAASIYDERSVGRAPR